MKGFSEIVRTGKIVSDRDLVKALDKALGKLLVEYDNFTMPQLISVTKNEVNNMKKWEE